jgi:hypothetical protein
MIESAMASLSIARVVVACYAGGETGSAIEAGVRLAARWRAKLHVAFLEDPQLQRLIGHPSARHVGLSQPALPVLEAGEIAPMLLAVAGRAQAQLALKAEREGLTWSFAVVSEAPTEAALGATESDFLVVEGTARPFAGHWRLRSCFSALALGASLPVLMIRPRHRPERVVAAIFAGETPGLLRSFAIAGDMAAGTGAELMVLAGPGAPPTARIREILAAGDLLPAGAVTVERIAGASVLQGAHGRFLKRALLVVDATSPPPGLGNLEPLGDLERLAEQADCDVLLVR